MIKRYAMAMALALILSPLATTYATHGDGYAEFDAAGTTAALRDAVRTAATARLRGGDSETHCEHGHRHYHGGGSSGASNRFRDFFGEMSCSDLTDSTPPLWLAGAVAANIQQGQVYPPVPYYPVCTLTYLDAYRNDAQNGVAAPFTWPTSTDDLHSRVVAWHEPYLKTAQTIRRLDSCTTPSSMRGDPQYQAQSRAAANMTTATSGDKASYARDVFNPALASVTAHCCGSNSACTAAMSAVTLNWCVPARRSSVSDSCTDGAFFSLDPKSEKKVDAFFAMDNSSDRLGEFPIVTGRVTLAPLKRNGEFVDSAQTIAHELGHACSHVQRSLQIRANDSHSSDAYYQTIQDQLYAMADVGSTEETSACSTSSVGGAVRNTYDRLFHDLGANADTIDCINSVTNEAAQQRFTSGSCRGGCPHRHLEEGYATVVSFLDTAPDHYVPDLLPALCSGQRDSQHPLAADILKCTLKTRSFRDRIERSIGCQH